MTSPSRGTAPETLTLALWAANLSEPIEGLEAWAARIEARMAEAAAEGARLLVMPEYAAEQWLAFKPAGLRPDEEIGWMAAQAPKALARLEPLAARHQIALLAGTMPWAVENGHRNRAWLILPDGRTIAQDKLVLTPGEQDPESWNLVTGDTLEIVEWAGLRLATLICLDIEMPALSARLARAELDLILVPSATEQLSGHSRVFGCAKARAVELMTAVAATGCIGAAPGTTQTPTNVSGAAVYLPCEPSLGHTGVHAETGPYDGAAGGAGPMLVARDVPLGAIRALRGGRAEVWPGAWPADHIVIREAEAGEGTRQEGLATRRAV